MLHTESMCNTRETRVQAHAPRLLSHFAPSITGGHRPARIRKHIAALLDRVGLQFVLKRLDLLLFRNPTVNLLYRSSPVRLLYRISPWIPFCSWFGINHQWTLREIYIYNRRTSAPASDSAGQMMRPGFIGFEFFRRCPSPATYFSYFKYQGATLNLNSTCLLLRAYFHALL